MKSECCGAEILNYNDGLGICSECKEHCGAECSEEEECSLLMNSTNPVNRKPLDPDSKYDMLISTLESILALNQLEDICSHLDLVECCELYQVEDSCEGCPFKSYESLQGVIDEMYERR